MCVDVSATIIPQPDGKWFVTLIVQETRICLLHVDGILISCQSLGSTEEWWSMGETNIDTGSLLQLKRDGKKGWCENFSAPERSFSLTAKLWPPTSSSCSEVQTFIMTGGDLRVCVVCVCVDYLPIGRSGQWLHHMFSSIFWKPPPALLSCENRHTHTDTHPDQRTSSLGDLVLFSTLLPEQRCWITIRTN